MADLIADPVIAVIKTISTLRSCLLELDQLSDVVSSISHTVLCPDR